MFTSSRRIRLPGLPGRRPGAVAGADAAVVRHRPAGQLLTALSAITGTVLAGLAAADDTEIFVRAIPPADPNVLLILDTSGSMESQLVVAEDYDPDVTYDGGCVADRVYYARQDSNVEVPECAEDNLLYVNLDAFFCDAAGNAMMTAGYFTDRFAQWDQNDERWENMSFAGFGEPPGEQRPVECEADDGLHGNGLDEDRVYAIGDADVADPGPWTDDDTNVLAWPGRDLFTFYSGNYLNWLNGDRELRVSTRMNVLKRVARDLIAGVGGMRIGLMRFSSDADGGMVIFPASDIDAPGNRSALNAAIDSMMSDGSTPLAETLFEAQRYLSGGAVKFGLDSVGNNGDPLPSVPESRSGNTYLSPMTQQCQASYTVLLTDGLPQADLDANGDIEALTGTACSGSCLDELSNWMAQHDQSPGMDSDDPVLTYTIGFFTDDPLLRSAATATRPDDNDDPEDDPPAYYTADDVLELSEALREVFEDIDADNSSFQSPAVAVDGFNRLVNSDDLYFSMFIPSGAPYWSGNIKKYRLAEGEGEMVIVDADGRQAIGDDGVFLDEARSEWSAEPDGADVLLGGVRNRLGTDRLMFTDPAYSGQNVDLWLETNRFSMDNELITPGMMGVPEDEFEELMRYLSGIDEEGNPAPIFGDPLHSNPTLVTFGDAARNTTLRMYVATNDGYFHALNVDPSSESEPLEEWTFIPSQMLNRLHRLKDNEVQNPASKGYGIDGPISYWIRNDDGDNVVESGETLYLYAAMRRGGRDYMAISVPGSNPSQPRLEWTIRGGVGDFAELGQSWSAATVARMDVNGSERTVLVFGGGYDAQTQDADGEVSQLDDVGRAVYVVDAITGERLWWAGPPDAAGGTPDLVLDDMTHSIPSDVTVIDTGGDGLADRMYVGDMGGRVWRFDIEDLPFETGAAVFADLGGDSAADNRRFFYGPSVSRVLDDVYGSFLTVSIGSGHRPNPLSSAVDDRFYMLRDVNVFAPPSDEDGNRFYPDPITEGALLDITTNVAPTPEQLNGTQGWLLRMVARGGEKNLSPALTADNKVFFTSYFPDDGEEPDCNLAGVIGGGLLYTVDLVTGRPVLLDDPLDGGEVDPSDRFQDLDLGGIPPAPQLIFTECEDGECLSERGDDEDGDEGEGGGPGNGNGTGCENAFSQVTLLIGTQTSDPGICNAPVRTFWRQNQ